MVLSKSFSKTQVDFNRSMKQIEGILEVQGIIETRVTHLRPTAPDATDGPESRGSLTIEFISESGGAERARRGVRITVHYQPSMKAFNSRHVARVVKGTTPEMAARALYWYLDMKFKSIEWGIEEFDVAFLPHLITQIGATPAEQQHIVEAMVDDPDSVGRLLLPPGGGP